MKDELIYSQSTELLQGVFLATLLPTKIRAVSESCPLHISSNLPYSKH